MTREPREIAARSLCRFEENPENTTFEGRPMWQSYLPQVNAIFTALKLKGISRYASRGEANLRHYKTTNDAMKALAQRKDKK